MEFPRHIETVLVATLVVCWLGGASARAADPYVHRVWFHDRDRGWLTGYAREPNTGFVIGKTVDGGRTWILTTGPPRVSSQELLFADADVGWVSYGWVFGTRIMATRDGGETWTLQVDSPGSLQTHLSFDRGGAGWTRGAPDVGDPAWVNRTEDGGHSWETVAAFDHGPRAVSFIGPVHGWLAMRFGGLMATKDGGETWRWTPSPAFVFMHFVSPEVGWAATYEDGVAALFRSRDGGVSWDPLPPVEVGSPYTLRGRSHSLGENDLWVARPSADNGGGELSRRPMAASRGACWRPSPAPWAMSTASTLTRAGWWLQGRFCTRKTADRRGPR